MVKQNSDRGRGRAVSKADNKVTISNEQAINCLVALQFRLDMLRHEVHLHRAAGNVVLAEGWEQRIAVSEALFKDIDAKVAR